ncbi:MAG TPA: hypothetical protein VHM23_23535 [Actinomycetota bacterium]|jgi:hypothetical protein|nr:hypothetical protein [Actinomycetota bacterium]
MAIHPVHVPGHIAAHPQVVVPHQDGRTWTHDHPHRHTDDDAASLHHPNDWAHRHEHRWTDPAHHHHDPA